MSYILSALVLLVSFSAFGNMDQLPLRSLRHGSTIQINFEGLPDIHDSYSYVAGKKTRTEIYDWSPRKPFCKISNLNWIRHYSNFKSKAFVVTKITGNYWPNGIPEVVDNPFFETKIMLLDGKDVFAIDCYSFDQDGFGEMSFGEFGKAMGDAVEISIAKIVNPGKDIRHVGTPGFVLNPQDLKKVKFSISQDIEISLPGAANFQEGRRLTELSDISIPLCQLLLWDRGTKVNPQSVVIPKGFTSHIEEVEADYVQGDSKYMDSLEGFSFGGKLASWKGPGELRLNCILPSASSYPRYSGISNITKNFINWAYQIKL
jgi:hypothetical protein